MKNKRVVTQEAFDGLLAWLDPDRELAAQAFLNIEEKLITFFARRGCPVADDLANEAMDRVCRRVEDIAPTYDGDPVFYFYRVSRNVYREWLDKEKRVMELKEKFDLRRLFSQKPDAEEYVYECLDDCLQELDARSRDELLCYYQFDGRLKLRNRKRIADDLGITPGALTTRMYRLRAELEPCVTNCSRIREQQRVV